MDRQKQKKSNINILVIRVVHLKRRDLHANLEFRISSSDFER